jgi:cyclophilin family peptidyl-prolyl cis-trans isomerase
MKKIIRFARLLYVTGLFIGSVSLVQAQSSRTERYIKIETNKGDMVVMLYDQTPGHRDNMVKLIEEGFYEGQLFHRVIKDFMIQGGDPHSVDAEKGQRLGTGGPGYTIPAEFNENLVHKKGALAAARMGDQVNPEQASSGSQFYIVQGREYTIDMLKMLEERRASPFTTEAIEAYTTLGGTPHLDGAYTVFGEVVEGLGVVDSIASSQTDSYNRPLEDVVYRISLVK